MLSNIDAILNAAGCSPADIVKVTLLLADIKDFKAVDQIYSAWLPGLGSPLCRRAPRLPRYPSGRRPRHARRRRGVP
jgi:2-iminobutanoate/2-iminopropanoate deaminase